MVEVEVEEELVLVEVMEVVEEEVPEEELVELEVDMVVAMEEDLELVLLVAL